MSFGFGVGDFIAVSVLIKGIVSSLKACGGSASAGCPISQPLSVSAYEIFGISVISQSVEVIKLSKSISW
jgi:hypothetical protein